MVVGLISDTHGLLRDEALAALAGVNIIIHAGDIGNPEILDRLDAVAPVVAVRGNIDRQEWASALPLTRAVQAGAARIYVIHNIHELDIDPVEAGFDIVVSGHSHKPGQSRGERIIYLNPGSAGPRRFKLPITVARLDLERKPWQADFIDL